MCLNKIGRVKFMSPEKKPAIAWLKEPYRTIQGLVFGLIRYKNKGNIPNPRTTLTIPRSKIRSLNISACKR
jgi:hypothetical protein